MNNVKPDEIISHYQMIPHPEGGFYLQSYRSVERIQKHALPSRFKGDRYICTAIYYLLQKGQKSKLHKILSDETWHFYLGSPLTIVGIDENGNPYSVELGQNIRAGQQLQYTVPANHWFGAIPSPGSEFSFVGCTVSPGFDFDDFEIGNKSLLLSLYPNAADLINRFL